MPTDEKAVKKLQRMMAFFDNDAITQEQFVKSFENVVNLVLKVEKRNSDFLDEAKQMIENIKTHVRGLSEDDFKKLKSQMFSEVGMLSSKLEKQQKQIDQKMAQLRDGMDGISPDPDEIAQKAAALFKLPEYRAPVLDGPQEIRDKLELLQGKERLKIEAIDNLREELDELKKLKGQMRVGGGTSTIGVQAALERLQVREEEVTFTGTAGSLATTPETNTVKLFRGGVRMQRGTGKDFTISGKDITLATAAVAGEIFIADYTRA